MRQLRYLTPGDDGQHVVVETADGTEQFVLFVTAAMREAVRSVAAELPMLHAAPVSEPEAGLSPREIQMRVRAGADPADLAEASKMELDRVLRFAGPVLEERIRMAEEARRARARRTTAEGPTVVFGEAVDDRFGAYGVDPFDVRWDSFRRGDGQWVITATWARDEDDHRAEWTFHLRARNVTPMDEVAADLLSDRPIRFAAPAVDEPADYADAPPLAPGVVAFPRLTPVPADDPRVTGTAAVEDVFDQDAVDDADGMPASFGSSALADADEVHAPPLPLRLAEAPADAEAADDQPAAKATAPLPKVKNLGVAHRDAEAEPQRRPSRSNRPKVPSWDDIMLGVRRPTD